MSAQLFINFIFGTAIGFLLAQWFFTRHHAKLLQISLSALQLAIAELNEQVKEDKR